ncbi:biotin transport system ATP-binding protein [Nakamurella sp. UYEF19]|uniref:energy-coupling factor ABC transporter ATP-binding protein n=1 Tax=Nakamurella sp. UYEF19 TaxID=1756392 RepID=UPI00339B27AC
MTEIRFQGVHHRFGERVVLDGIDLTLTEQRIGIVGGNGSGKSTLARMINGLVEPTSGVVSVDGLDTVREGRKVRQQVGFVFTDPDNQIVMPTVAEDIGFSLRRSGLSKAEIADRVSDSLRRFGLSGHADHPTHLLSGGQKQLLALAAVLIRRPAVVVADEPTTLLDLRNARMVSELLGSLDEQVVLVTHHLQLLTDFDRVLLIDGGRVAADGPPASTTAHYEASST